MQQLQNLWADRVLRRRVTCAGAGTIAVLTFSPPATVLVAASALLWPLAWCEWRSARQGSPPPLALPSRESATA